MKNSIFLLSMVTILLLNVLYLENKFIYILLIIYFMYDIYKTLKERLTIKSQEVKC